MERRSHSSGLRRLLFSVGIALVVSGLFLVLGQLMAAPGAQASPEDCPSNTHEQANVPGHEKSRQDLTDETEHDNKCKTPVPEVATATPGSVQATATPGGAVATATEEQEEATATSVPPTATASGSVATATSVPPTATSMAATATSVPPTATSAVQLGATATSVPNVIIVPGVNIPPTTGNVFVSPGTTFVSPSGVTGVAPSGVTGTQGGGNVVTSPNTTQNGGTTSPSSAVSGATSGPAASALPATGSGGATSTGWAIPVGAVLTSIGGLVFLALRLSRRTV